MLEIIRDVTGISPEVQTKIYLSIIIFFVLGLTRVVVLKVVWRRTEEVRTRYTWKKSMTYILSIIGLLVVGDIWIESFGQLVTFFGLLSAGLAIALKDPIVNMVGWSFILIRKPFALGDRIQIGDKKGDVIDIRLFQFTIMEIGNWVDAEQSTGRIIHIPNGKVFTEGQANYSQGFDYLWNEVPVLVTFESNWEKAKEILNEIAVNHAAVNSKPAEEKIKEASKRFMIFYYKLTPIVYTKVEASGVLLTIRYLCKPRKRRSSEHQIWEEILHVFAKYDDIEFAYPTQRFYSLGNSEGTGQPHK